MKAHVMKLENNCVIVDEEYFNEIKDSRYNKISVCHFGTIENGNNQNAANIIDHCKCRQENFQTQRHPFTQQTEYTQ